MKKYVCTSGICVGCCYEPCEYVYVPKVGDTDHGIEPMTDFKDIPDDWVCPNCGGGKEVFVPADNFKKKY